MSDFQGTLNKVLADPEQMEKLAGIAKSLMGDGKTDSSGAAAGAVGFDPSALDPKMMSLMMKLMQEYNSGSDKEALLAAIKPFLKDSRRSRIEQAAQMAKLARLAKVAMANFSMTENGG